MIVDVRAEVRCLIIICFSLLFSNYSTCFSIFFYFVFLFRMFLLCCVLCVLYCYVYYFSFVFSCLFPVSVQVYRPLPPGGNPTAFNKYHIICTKSDVCRIRIEYFNSFKFFSFTLQAVRERILAFRF